MTEQNLTLEETEYPTTDQKQRISLLSRLSPKVIVAGVLVPAAAILGIIVVDIATPNPVEYLVADIYAEDYEPTEGWTPPAYTDQWRVE